MPGLLGDELHLARREELRDRLRACNGFVVDPLVIDRIREQEIFVSTKKGRRLSVPVVPDKDRPTARFEDASKLSFGLFGSKPVKCLPSYNEVHRFFRQCR